MGPHIVVVVQVELVELVEVPLVVIQVPVPLYQTELPIRAVEAEVMATMLLMLTQRVLAEKAWSS